MRTGTAELCIMEKGSFFNNLAASLDVAAHEFGHGVVEYTAGLRYHNQSGALNESFADLFGAMVDRDDWLIGEDLYDDGQALRDMETPENGNQPSTFMNYRHLPDTREGDWGGVHINSGIQNRAFYLLAEGLSLEGLGVSIGKETLEQIAYQALLRLGEDAEFIDAYLQMKLVAEDLYGSETLASVEAAWDAVGISEAKVPQSNDVEIDFVLASGSDAIAYLFPSTKRLTMILTTPTTSMFTSRKAYPRKRSIFAKMTWDQSTITKSR